jgi:hypothetical protein
VDLLSFIATVVGHVAWPATVLIAGFLLRKPLLALLPELRRLRYKDLEVDFGKELEHVEAQLDAVVPKQLEGPKEAAKVPELQDLPKTREELIERIAALSPSAAILESWSNVERTLNFYFSVKGVEKPKSGQSILRYLDYDPNFPPHLISVYQELRLLRNRAAHDRDGITVENARDFNELADRLTLALIQATEAGPR